MFSIDTPLPPPRRNLEDADEDLLEGLGAENLLEAKDSIEPPVLRWKKSFHQEMMMQNQDENVYHCDFLICAGGKASPLLCLFSNLDEDTMVGSILIPGAVVSKANATLKASDPNSVSCNIHKAKISNTVLINCNIEVPLESLHAWAKVVLKHIQPTKQVLVFDLDTTINELRPRHYLENAEGDEEGKALNLRHFCTTNTSSSSSSNTTTKSLLEQQKYQQIASRLEVGCPVTGLSAALLGRCQLLGISAIGLLGQLNPSSANQLRRELKMVKKMVDELVFSVEGGRGGGGGNGEEEGMEEAIKRLTKQGHLRLQARSALYT